MPRKRGRSSKSGARRNYGRAISEYGGGSVTGGTGDVKPQIMTVSTGLAAAADDYTVKRFGVPVPRFGPEADMSTIMEILSVDFYPYIESMSDNTGHNFFCMIATSEIRQTSETSTLSTAADDLASPFCLVGVLNVHTVASAVGRETVRYPMHCDLTDSNGNGVLVAGDSLYLIQGDEAAQNLSKTVAKIKYRLVNVGISEYVGILQAQSG